MNAEDRIRTALDSRAAAARTSPDALDSVFGRVARHRRNVRLAVAGGTALSLAAVAVAATTLTGADRALQPTTPTVTAPPPSVAVPTTEPTVSPTPTELVPTSSPDSGFAPDRAVVVLSDRTLVEISTTTGATVRELGRAHVAPERNGLAWSPDRTTVYYATADCHLYALDVASGQRTEVVRGAHPAVSPDGTLLATASCAGDPRLVQVTELPAGRTRTFAPMSRDPEDFFAANARPVDLAWYDETRLLVARSYEGEEPLLVLDVTRDTKQDDGELLERTFVKSLGARDQRVYGLTDCCYPEHDKPEDLLAIALSSAEQRRAATFAGEFRDVAVDGAGTVLLVDRTGVWRWSGTATPVLIRRGAVGVATP